MCGTANFFRAEEPESSTKAAIKPHIVAKLLITCRSMDASKSILAKGNDRRFFVVRQHLQANIARLS